MSVANQEVDFIVNEAAPLISKWADHWTILPVDSTMSPATQNQLHRLNALGSSYYFIKIVLRKHRLVEHLHKAICDALEKDSLKEVLEIPRDHFKSTICSEGMPMWWALPFTIADEMYMRALGYDEEWIRWMRIAHNQDTRTLLVSANIKNAGKLGRRIDHHYSNNSFFRGLFPEILPDSSSAWAVESMTQKRTNTSKASQGEGTYDYLGVGAALQSRHYDRIIEDDLVGLDALDSELIMQGIIDYHKLLAGAFDSVSGRPDLTGDEVVVGNRWYYEDLNSYLREFETNFNFTSHSALGGCCSNHPMGVPIFPEEWTLSKLKEFERRLGTYFFSCQFLNTPTPPGESKFIESNLRWFNFERVVTGSKVENGKEVDYYKMKIVHSVKKGEVLKDQFLTPLNKEMIVDPSHAGKNGRSRHCIVIVGFVDTPPRQYLLDVWADSNDYSALVNKMYELGEKWKIKVPKCEGVAFQSFLSYHFETLKKSRTQLGKWVFDKVDTDTLKTDRSEDGKSKRIEGMAPVYERGEFWVPRMGAEKFLDEYNKYPYSKYKDILDTLGYSLQLWKPGKRNREEVRNFLLKRQEYFVGQSRSITGY